VAEKVDIVVRLKDQASKGFSKLAKSADIAKKSLMGIAGIGASGFVAVGAGLAKSIKIASSVAEDAAKFNVVFANTGKQVTQQLE